MSLFSLFFRNQWDLPGRTGDGSKLLVTGSTQPVTSQNKPFGASSVESGASTSAKSVDDKSRQGPAARDSLAAHGMADVADNERRRVQALERREQLYGSVRESLLRVEILAASYRFKVLALDQSGQQYLVMIDLPSNIGRSAVEMAEIGNLITDNARSQYELAVKAVYWRLDDDLVQVSIVPCPAARPPMAQPQNVEVKEPAVLVMGDAPHSRGLSTLEAEEVLAFRRALLAIAAKPDPVAGAQPPSHGYRSMAAGYEDTEMAKL